MKNMYLLLVLLVFQGSYAQDIRLLDTWYLQNLIVDGQDNFPPVNYEVPYVNLIFSETEFFTGVCDGILGTITYDPLNPEFNLIDAGISLGGCGLPINLDFQMIYLDDFWFMHHEDVFSYQIVDGSNNIKTLTVNNIEGDQAIYGNEILSTEDLEISQFSIYPNPAKNELFFKSKSKNGSINTTVYNIQGKVLNAQYSQFKKHGSIDVSKLSSGIYFLSIEDEKGHTTIRKFIKE